MQAELVSGFTCTSKGSWVRWYWLPGLSSLLVLGQALRGTLGNATLAMASSRASFGVYQVVHWFLGIFAQLVCCLLTLQFLPWWEILATALNSGAFLVVNCSLDMLAIFSWDYCRCHHLTAFCLMLLLPFPPLWMPLACLGSCDGSCGFWSFPLGHVGEVLCLGRCSYLFAHVSLSCTDVSLHVIDRVASVLEVGWCLGLLVIYLGVS
jgi:hypothetical protein